MPDSRRNRYSTSPADRSCASSPYRRRSASRRPARSRESSAIRTRPGCASTSSSVSYSDRFARRPRATRDARSVPPRPYTSEAASAYTSTVDDGSASARSSARRRRISGREYSPDAPENRHGTPATLRARRYRSASAFERTRIAWERGGAPPAIRSAMSRATASASSPPLAYACAPHRDRPPAALGDEPLRDARLHLQAVGVVEPDEAVGGIEDRRPGSVVAPEDDLRGARVPVEEAEDVADRRAAEPVDRLVVVPDDRHVPCRVREERDELPLGAVRVLELVHEDVPIPGAEPVTGGRRLADEAEGEAHLVAEVHVAALGHEVLVAGVRGGELRVPAREVRRHERSLAVRGRSRRDRRRARPPPPPAPRGVPRTRRSRPGSRPRPCTG